MLLLQTLAETAARSTTPILLLTILHMAFGDYLRAHDEARRSEWRKVQGRFVDVAFQEPTAEVLRLVGLTVDRSLPPPLEHAYVKCAQAAAAAAPLADASRRLPLAELLPGCAPLDPITALLLPPLFCGKLAQNERSLFAFLTGLEPHGFLDFLRGSTWDGGLAPTYRLDRLYDYVSAALGMAVYSGDQARRWSEIEGALARVAPDAPRMVAPVVKAVGLLSLYGRHLWLKSDEATLALALGPATEVAEAIAYLKRASILVYRQYEQAYALWEGSDLDVDDLYAQARQRLERGPVAARLKRALALRPVVARAHYIRTGTLRYLPVEVIDGSQGAVAAALAKDTQPADGAVVYVLAGDDRQRGEVLSRACELAEELPAEAGVRLLAFPSPMLGLEEALREVEAWRSVRDDVPALHSDPVARREVRVRLQAAQEQLESLCGQTFPLPGHLFRPEVSDWIHRGEVHRPPSAQGFQEWISGLCDVTFAAAPLLQNELLNRQQLSSAASAARRTLLEAMLAHEAEFRLGLSGTPAEVTMYESLLRHGGFHRQRDGRWEFGEPGEQWQAVWAAMVDFLATTHAGRRPVEHLYDALRRPPFGLLHSCRSARTGCVEPDLAACLPIRMLCSSRRTPASVPISLPSTTGRRPFPSPSGTGFGSAFSS